MDIYNPYLNLVQLAGHNVLKGEDRFSNIYPVFEGYVYVGAVQASIWLISGKSQSKDEAINEAMEDVKHLTDSAFFPEKLARHLMELGFDWLAQFEIEDNPPTYWETRRNTEAI